ncbi:MAG: hypothetical protein H6565_12945 [Lewinellaceae bacterium]|nr:hypothetical protein [Lewinellaceae bacterium]
MKEKKALKTLIGEGHAEKVVEILLTELDGFLAIDNDKSDLIDTQINDLTIISDNLKSIPSKLTKYDFEQLERYRNRNLLSLLSSIDIIYKDIFSITYQDDAELSGTVEEESLPVEVYKFSLEAYRQTTENCLIAADIDKTILSQDKGIEEKKFKKEIAPLLIQAAQLHTNIALITGNSMHELCTRFFKWLVYAIHEAGADIKILTRFHFFCNSGGTYVYFTSEILRTAVGEGVLTAEELYNRLTFKKDRKVFFIREAIHIEYINRTKIPERDINHLLEILNDVKKQINELISKDSQQSATYEPNKYHIDNIENYKPEIDLRSVESFSGEKSIIQITLKPVLSYHSAKKGSHVNHKNDFRTKIVEEIRKRLHDQGFSNYDVKPGGRTSIDITLDKLDKAYALEFLIDKLNIQGSKRLKEGDGAHTIYLGDEVIVGGGNDYPVTRIPGLLVFAVNEDKGYVPLHSRVIVPYTNLSGPEVVEKVLRAYNFGAKMLLRKHDEGQQLSIGKSAIDALKKNYFLSRIINKIENWNLNKTTNREVQILHAIVTLICREDSSKGLITMLVNELDSIMELIDETKDFQAIGTSYDESD